MPKRRTANAAEFIERKSLGVSIILAELAETAGVASRAWNLAVATVRTNPDAALTYLVEAEIRLEHFGRNEVRDTLRPIRAAIDRLDAELPDDPDESRPLPTNVQVIDHLV